jgi:hypothetical protein
MGSGCIDPHFLDLDTSWRWVDSFTPLPLYPRRKSPRYPFDRSLGGPHSWSGRRGEEKILDPTGTQTQTPWPSSLYPVAIPTALSRLPMYTDILPSRQCQQSVLNTVSFKTGINAHVFRALNTLQKMSGRDQYCWIMFDEILERTYISIRSLIALRVFRIVKSGQDTQHCKSCSSFNDLWPT